MGEVVLNLRDGSLAAPIIATASLPISTPGRAWYHFRFAQPVAVTPGATYFLDLGTTNESILVERRGADADCPFIYPGGGAVHGGDRVVADLLVRIYAPDQ